jgi:hypothetical protein
MSEEQNETDLLLVVKELTAAITGLNGRIAALEQDNGQLRKAVEDPEILMKKHGWIKFTTPHADETFDPMQRPVPDISGPFSGSGDTFLKSRDETLAEWEAAERMVNNQ